MLVDSENALRTQNVLALLDGWGVKVGVFPPGLGKLMNPCDSYFHSLVKRRYYQLVNENVSSAVERKLMLIRQAYFSVSENSILSFFEHCGIIGEKEPEDLVNHLLSEGLHPSKKFADFHRQQVEAYEGWCKINDKDPDLTV